MSFVTCEPNLKHANDYKDESDIFFDEPVSWLRKNPHLINDATYVVLYENLYNKIYDELDLQKKFKICEKFFNSFVKPTTTSDKNLFVLCLKKLRENKRDEFSKKYEL
jgi:hypothetical protein